MKAWKRKVTIALMVLVTGVVCYWVGNNNGYVDGWMEGKITEHLYTRFMDDLCNGEHLKDEEIESEIVKSYVRYTYNETPTAQQAKDLFNLLEKYVFWGFESEEPNLSD